MKGFSYCNESLTNWNKFMECIHDLRGGGGGGELGVGGGGEVGGGRGEGGVGGHADYVGSVLGS